MSIPHQPPCKCSPEAWYGSKTDIMLEKPPWDYRIPVDYGARLSCSICTQAATRSLEPQNTFPRQINDRHTYNNLVISPDVLQVKGSKAASLAASACIGFLRWSSLHVPVTV